MLLMLGHDQPALRNTTSPPTQVSERNRASVARSRSRRKRVLGEPHVLRSRVQRLSPWRSAAPAGSKQSIPPKVHPQCSRLERYWPTPSVRSANSLGAGGPDGGDLRRSR